MLAIFSLPTDSIISNPWHENQDKTSRYLKTCVIAVAIVNALIVKTHKVDAFTRVSIVFKPSLVTSEQNGTDSVPAH